MVGVAGAQLVGGTQDGQGLDSANSCACLFSCYRDFILRYGGVFCTFDY